MLRNSLKADDFLVAASPAMRAVVAAVESYSAEMGPVLICGEHGTGRELVARVLHRRGPRAAKKFIAVRPTFEDAPTTPAPGAATITGRDGDACERAHRALRAANGGTLLVKDVSDLSARSQRTLRRAIRYRDGDTGGELFERWVKHYAVEIGRTAPTISSRAIARLTSYPWPGNVAELKSIARRLVVRVSGARIEAGDVDEILPVVAERVPLDDLAFEDMVKGKLAGLLARIDGYPVHDLYDKVLARVERPLFDLVLAHTGGNQLKAAEILGLNRNTLRKKLAALGIDQTKKRTGREDRALDGK